MNGINAKQACPNKQSCTRGFQCLMLKPVFGTHFSLHFFRISEWQWSDAIDIGRSHDDNDNMANVVHTFTLYKSSCEVIT